MGKISKKKKITIVLDVFRLYNGVFSVAGDFPLQQIGNLTHSFIRISESVCRTANSEIRFWHPEFKRATDYSSVSPSI